MKRLRLQPGELRSTTNGKKGRVRPAMENQDRRTISLLIGEHEYIACHFLPLVATVCLQLFHVNNVLITIN